MFAPSVRVSNASQPRTRTKPRCSIRTAEARDHAVRSVRRTPRSPALYRVLARYTVWAQPDLPHQHGCGCCWRLWKVLRAGAASWVRPAHCRRVLIGRARRRVDTGLHASSTGRFRARRSVRSERHSERKEAKTPSVTGAGDTRCGGWRRVGGRGQPAGRSSPRSAPLRRRSRPPQARPSSAPGTIPALAWLG